jgi:imidazolonepropionase-like amidohydrolase
LRKARKQIRIFQLRLVEQTMKIISTMSLILITALLTLAQTANQPKLVAVRSARLIDVKSGSVINNAVILIEGERITAVGSNLVIPSAAQVIDLGGATVLPGLIDCHTHLLVNHDLKFEQSDCIRYNMSTTKRALLGAAMGREDLEAGITTVRDLGNSGRNGDVALRDAINAGWVVGPRMVVSTRALSNPRGQFPLEFFSDLPDVRQKLIEDEYVGVASIDEARKAVQWAVADGANCIKVIVSLGTELEVLNAIVELAHRGRLKVAAHAIGDYATRIAAKAGVDSIEHAYVVPDDVLKMMAEKKIFLVPTDLPLDTSLTRERESNLTPEQLKRSEEQVRASVAGSADRLRRAMKAGVPIAFGSDMYVTISGKTRGQLSVMVL